MECASGLNGLCHGNFADQSSELMGTFQQCVHTTPVGVLIADHLGAISYVNQSLCSCFGYQLDELLGQSIELLVPNAIKNNYFQFRDSYPKNPAKRWMIGREVPGRRKDGTPVDIAIGLNWMDDGETVVVGCTVLDLNPFTQSEKSLESFFNLSLDLFCIANTEGSFLRVNSNFTRILGYSEQELLSRPFMDFIHPDDIAATRDAVLTLSAGEPVVRFRNRYRHLEGGHRWIEWSATTIPGDEIIFAVGRDVTEEVKFIRELQIRELRERAILDNTPASVYLKDTQGKYLYANQRYATLFSLDHSALIGKTDHELFSSQLSSGSNENWREVTEIHNPTTFRETTRHQDGLHTYVSVKFPLLDVEGDVAAVACISTDITEQLKSQDMHAQLKLAALFQRKLFPEHAPSVHGLDLAGSAVPVSDLCGDYFDYIVTSPERITIVVGDVSGHGVGPALAMVEARSTLRSLLREDPGGKLSDIVMKLNRLLVEDLPDGTFMSLFLAEIDLARRQFRYVGAGHDAFLFRMGESAMHFESTGPVIGFLPSAHFPEMPPITIRDDDVFLICTDGVYEAMNNQRELFGRQRINDCVEQFRNCSSEAIIQHLFARVIGHAEGRAISDDMTAVVAKVLPETGRTS